MVRAAQPHTDQVALNSIEGLEVVQCPILVLVNQKACREIVVSDYNQLAQCRNCNEPEAHLSEPLLVSLIQIDQNAQDGEELKIVSQVPRLLETI